MTPQVPKPIPTVTTLEEVVDATTSIIDWSIGASCRLGYFAALYKRITIAVQTAVTQGAFEDGPRTERFDVKFASRYFDALNGYFHPGRFPRPTRSWQIAFDATRSSVPIVVQHLLAGVTAHIDLDLGIAVPQLAPGTKIAALRNDFNAINAILASQVNDIVAGLDEISPALAELYAVLANNEMLVFNVGLGSMRESAWRFATLLALEPKFAHSEAIWARDRHVAGQVAAIYDPPELTGLIESVVRAIAERESRDIVKNIHALDALASAQVPIHTSC